MTHEQASDALQVELDALREENSVLLDEVNDLKRKYSTVVAWRLCTMWLAAYLMVWVYMPLTLFAFLFVLWKTWDDSALLGEAVACSAYPLPAKQQT